MVHETLGYGVPGKTLHGETLDVPPSLSCLYCQCHLDHTCPFSLLTVEEEEYSSAGNSIEMAQASTLTFRVMACPSHLSCHLLPIHREPKGNAVLLPTVLASPPWGTANQEETRHLPKEKEASIWVLTPNSCKAMGKYQRLTFLQISAEH